MWYLSNERMDDCRRIVDDHILPEIRNFGDAGEFFASASIVAAADALFCARSIAAVALFKALDSELRDAAIWRAAMGMLRRLPVDAAFSAPDGYAFSVSFEDLMEILTLVELCDSDSMIWSIISHVAQSAKDDPKKRYSNQQRKSISLRLHELAENLLPRKGWIAHDGYRLLAMAAAKGAGGNEIGINDDILVGARGISNLSDRCFTLASLSRWAKRSCRSQIIEESAAVARGLTVVK
jgi:hypothetical protein